MFEVDVNGLTQQYRSKPIMNINVTGSSASIPKPLTYDYMPEGYPSKSIDTVTLMEEQEVTFSEDSGKFLAPSPIILDIQSGDKLTVAWDGINYEVVVTTLVDGVIMFGNPAIIGAGETTDYPFCYIHQLGKAPGWATTDTATSHTIKVMRQQLTITPMSADFIPKNFNVAFSGGSGSSIPTSCNVTYDELRGWIGNSTPVFAIYKIEDDNGSVSSAKNIINFEIDTDSLRVYYGSGANFKYNSDGTFSGSGVES